MHFLILIYQTRVAMIHALHFKPETLVHIHFQAFTALLKTETICLSHSNKSRETIKDFAKSVSILYYTLPCVFVRRSYCFYSKLLFFLESGNEHERPLWNRAEMNENVERRKVGNQLWEQLKSFHAESSAP